LLKFLTWDSPELPCAHPSAFRIKMDNNKEAGESPADEIVERLGYVAKGREAVEDLRARKRETYDAYLTTNNLLFERLAVAEATLLVNESAVRDIAIEMYSQTEIKDLPGGVKIKMRTFLVYDENTALEWAMKHNLAVKLDKSKFEKLAKVQEIPGVSVHNKPMATIPSRIELPGGENEDGN